MCIKKWMKISRVKRTDSQSICLVLWSTERCRNLKWKIEILNCDCYIFLTSADNVQLSSQRSTSVWGFSSRQLLSMAACMSWKILYSSCVGLNNYSQNSSCSTCLVAALTIDHAIDVSKSTLIKKLAKQSNLSVVVNLTEVATSPVRKSNCSIQVVQKSVITHELPETGTLPVCGQAFRLIWKWHPRVISGHFINTLQKLYLQAHMTFVNF